LNIPARYVFGYMPDPRVSGPQPATDFHAWFEAYLDGRWWTFDARFNTPLIGRIPIGIGRDAVDVAMVTSYGPAAFQRMTVWVIPSDEREREPQREERPMRTPESSEALVVEAGHQQEGTERA
jgi:transglutaminase-like putative cysteine protease